MRSRLCVALAATAFVLSMRVAHAQPSNGDQLFADAMKLIEEEKFEEAIPKLEEAQRIDPGIGTQFNLASCYAKTGKLAAAWRNYLEVERHARAAGKKEREAATRQALDELRSRVPHLEITAAAGVTVRVDGAVVLPAELGFLALDMGEHNLEAVAASRKPFEQRVTIDREGAFPVVIPELEAIKPVTITKETTNTRRTLAIASAGVGVAGLATAIVTGAMVLSAKSTAEERCRPDCLTATGEPDQEGNDAVRRGTTLLPINLVAWIVAGAGLGVGTFLYLTSRSSPKAARWQSVTIAF